MKIGVPKEIKVLEYRVGMVPAGVRELRRIREFHSSAADSARISPRGINRSGMSAST